MVMAVLTVRDLHVSFFTYAGEVKAVRGVSFQVDEGEAVAIVGESGCGKSVTALSVMRLIADPPGKVRAASLELCGRELQGLSESEMERIRGDRVAMVFQDPMTSLNPVLTIGTQLMEAIRRHRRVSSAEARRRAVELLKMVEIPGAEERLAQYPHQFSGGMRQRVMIAMALACNPALLIADEPTTALDVTIQAQILDLIKELKERTHTSVILITHDLGVVARLAQRVIVMYAGLIVESGSVNEIYYQAAHPYTVGLLKSVPRLDSREKRRLVPIYGQPPDLIAPPTGCPFWPRCDYAMKLCAAEDPPELSVTSSHKVKCWLCHPDVREALKVVGA
ncbi:MAG TPA: ABC transporter ATP-binding protein [Firmicutes bacterium]|nr:ABC transporter ATP-binding protein [Bacillota bacterium]